MINSLILQPTDLSDDLLKIDMNQFNQVQINSNDGSIVKIVNNDTEKYCSIKNDSQVETKCQSLTDIVKQLQNNKICYNVYII